MKLKKSRTIINQRLETMSGFPAIIFKGGGDTKLFTKFIINETNLTATELKSIRWISVYLFIGLISDIHQDV